MKILFPLILLSCAVFAQDEAAIAKAKSACGPDNIFFDVYTGEETHALATPAPGKALVFVIGENVTCAACDVTVRVGMDSAWAGAIEGSSWIAMNVEPGEHHLCTNWQSSLAGRRRHVALAGFTAENGKVYFFRLRVNTREEPVLDLDAINGDEGRYLVAEYRASEFHARKPGKTSADSSD